MTFIRKKKVANILLFLFIILYFVLLVSCNRANDSKLLVENEKGEKYDLDCEDKQILLINISADNIEYLPEFGNFSKIIFNSGIKTLFVYDRSIKATFDESELENIYYLSDDSINLEKQYSVYYNGEIISSLDDPVESIDYILKNLTDNSNIEHELLSFLITLDTRTGTIINSKSDKMLYLFSLTGCEMCNDVEKVLFNPSITAEYHSIKVIYDTSNDSQFFDPFNYISGFFDINEFPALMEIDKNTLAYEIDNQDLVTKVLKEMDN